MGMEKPKLLKKCPFCRKDSAIMTSTGAVTCDSTLCQVAVGAISVDVWNTRPLETAIVAVATSALSRLQEEKDIEVHLANLENALKDIMHLVAGG